MPPAAKNKLPAPVLYADRDNGDLPICLACFPRVRSETQDPDQYDEWVKVQESTRAAWESIPDGIRQKRALDGPHGWVKLLLDSHKWTPVKGRCWACSRQLALSYRGLVEEIRGAQPVAQFRALCRTAAVEANTLALEIAASGYRPIVRILDPDPKYGHLPALVASHVASMRELIAEPDPLSVKVLWGMFHKRLVKTLQGDAKADGPGQIKYEPLILGAQKLWEIAVILKQTADMGAVVDRNFAGVVRASAKDPHNLPERLALVAAYQWAQQMVPKMGQGELAKVLIEHEVVDGKWWGDDVPELEANIKRAVKKYRHLMPLQTYLLR